MSDEPGTSNCTDETKREAYLEALRAKIEEERAKSVHDKKLGEYRSVLKKYKKLGVDEEAIVYALKTRFDDPDEIIIREREKLKMLDLSGITPNIKDRLLSRLDVEEATTNEANTLDLAKAGDLGTQVGLAGRSRDENPFEPGTERHVHWLEGWLSGQRAIAEEMEGGAPPPVGETKRGRGRPAGSTKRAAAVAKRSVADQFKPDTAEDVQEVVAADEAEQDLPDIVA